MGGSKTVDEAGVYGDIKEDSEQSYPGGRNYAVGAYDELRQEFWLFGGYGLAKQQYVYGAMNNNLIVFTHPPTTKFTVRFLK